MKVANSRSAKSIINARVSTLFFLVTLFLSFFSRKIFIESFGVEFIGLTGTLANLLDFLNLAELGIGAAVGVVLYKSLNDQDQKGINEIIAVFGYLYRRIGYLIALAGIALSCFLPVIFPHINFPYKLVYSIYFVYLFNVLIGYFANYKQTLLGADQKNYIVISYFQTATVIKTIIQILIARFTGNYYLWIVVELIFGISYSILLNQKIKQVYPWLQAEVENGKLLRKKYPAILQYAKQLFVHKIGTLVQVQIRPLLIYSFSSLQTVTLFGNYGIIVDKLGQLLNNLLGSTGAGVGHMIAQGDKKQILAVFEELNALRYFIGGIAVFGIAVLINPFVSIWLGRSFVLSSTTLSLILINMAMGQARGTVDQFLYGYGIFRDVWAPIAESAISLVVSLVGGYFWGLNGILLGSTCSMFLIIIIWKPILLYNEGFKMNVRKYWYTVSRYYLVNGLSGMICYMIFHDVNWGQLDNYGQWALFAGFVVTLFSMINFIGFYIISTGFRFFVKRIMSRFISM